MIEENRSKEKPEKMNEEDWKCLDYQALTLIQLNLTDEVFFSIDEEEIAMGLWKNIEETYMMKSMTNKLDLKGAIQLEDARRIENDGASE